MTADPKKKPTAGFWITVILLVVLVAYPLSFGPACWLASHCSLPEPVEYALYLFYLPIRWLGRYGPRPVLHAIVGYQRLWTGD